VEDQPDYQELLTAFLTHAGHTVTAADCAAEVRRITASEEFDLVLLDVMLPGDTDGFGICAELRQKQDIPVIMLTALDDEAHQLKGYTLKIDDYITKPVSMPLLVEKVEAVLRRSKKQDPLLHLGGVTLDRSSYQVTVNGELCDLTLREYDILLELMDSAGTVVTRTHLLQKLWGYDYYGDTRIVDTHMKNLRKKLGDACCIETVRGVGYRMTAGQPE
jgi:two-component system response regulator VanR